MLPLSYTAGEVPYWKGDTMHWLQTLVFVILVGLGSNLDDISVGVAYGVKKIRLPLWVIAVTEAVGLVGACIGAFAGTFVSQYISEIEAKWCSCIVLCCIGLFVIYSTYVHPFMSHHAMELPKPGFRQALLLGVGLSFTDMASGFGATISDIATWWMNTISITAFGFMAVWIGNIIGEGLISKVLDRYAALFAGLLLVLVGVHQLF
jgi:putative Mn2+ efflux pump MntP